MESAWIKIGITDLEFGTHSYAYVYQRIMYHVNVLNISVICISFSRYLKKVTLYEHEYEPQRMDMDSARNIILEVIS